MKFSCDSCGAQYQIGDDKLGPRGVKVRCKRCGHMIVVRRSSKSGQPEEEEALGGPVSATHAVIPSPAEGLSSEDEFEPKPTGESGSDSVPRTAMNPPLSHVGDSSETSNGIGPRSDAKASLAVAPRPDEGLVAYSQDLDDLNGSGSADPFLAGEDEPLPGLDEHADAAFPSVESPEVQAPLPPAPELAILEPNLHTAPTETYGADVPDFGAAPARELVSHHESSDFDPRLLPISDADDSSAEIEIGHAFEAMFQAGDSAAPLGVKVPSAFRSPSGVHAPVSEAGVVPMPFPASSEGLVPFSSPQLSLASPATAAEPPLFALADVPLEEPYDPPPPVAAVSATEVRAGPALGALEPTEHSPPDLGKAADADEVQVEGATGKSAEAPTASPVTGAEAEWFVAIDDEQVGPLTYTEVQARWASGAIGADSLCWRQGMADWLPIENVPELAELTAGPSSRPRVSTTGAAFGPQQVTGEVAPAIALTQSTDEGEAPAASPAGQETGWRPSAASALASLAAEELQPDASESVDAAPLTKPTAGKMTAIPTAPNELSRLLDGDRDADDRTASMFGVNEKSVSKVRAIPRRAETLGSAPLAERRPANVASQRLGLLAAGVVALAFIGVGASVLSGGGSSRSRSPAEVPVPTARVQQRATEPQPPAKRSAPTPPVHAAKPASKKPDPAPASTAAARGPAQATSTPPTPPASDSTDSTPRAKKVRKKRRKKPTRAKPAPVSSLVRSSTPEPRPPVRSRPAGGSSDDELLAAAGPRTTPRSRPKPPPTSLPSKLDETAVFRVLREHKTQVRDCINKHRNAETSRGRVQVTITIQPSGRVTRTAYEPRSFGSQVLGRCLSSNARTWRFPRFAGSPTPVGFPVTVR